MALFGSFMIRRYRDGLENYFSPDALQAHSDGLLTSVTENPLALINPEALKELEDTLSASMPLGEGNAGLVSEVLAGLQNSLAAAISDVFVIVFLLLVVTIVATAFLKEIPLRKHGGPPPAEAQHGSAASPGALAAPGEDAGQDND